MRAEENRIQTDDDNQLVSNEEDKAVEFLKKNLQLVNDKSQRVTPADNLYVKYIKRIIDIAISFPICVVLIPVNIVFALCTLIDVGRPIIFKQARIGKDGKPFVMKKFRNMRDLKDGDGKQLPASERITKFGYFMRKYSLDELLNFWNVLKGEMSIIGPRPLPPFLYSRMCERHKMRCAVKPGIECPRVIHIKDENIYVYQRSYENDIWYVENVSFVTDIKMFIRLIKMVFSMNMRSNQASGRISYFVGYDDTGNAISMDQYMEYYCVD